MMAKTLGLRLFTGYSALNRMFRKLDLNLHRTCDGLLGPGGETSDAELPGKLSERFLLTPVMLKAVIDVKMRAYSEFRLTRDPDEVPRFLAEARIPYEGSAILLRTAPEPRFAFPFVGRIGRSSVRFMRYLPSLDATAFVAEAKREMERAQEALQRSRGDVYRMNDRINEAIDSKLRTY